jgi:hypothetical protein
MSAKSVHRDSGYPRGRPNSYNSAHATSFGTKVTSEEALRVADVLSGFGFDLKLLGSQRYVSDKLQSYSQELGLDLTKPKDRFKWFLASVLFAKRISAETAKETYLYFEQEELAKRMARAEGKIWIMPKALVCVNLEVDSGRC